MKTSQIVPTIAVLSMFLATIASAQTYPVSGGGTIVATGASGCVNLAGDLSLGARGANVISLQNFLVGQNYSGTGSWMITGYFGAATKQAVMNFQSQQGTVRTGVVDAQTRAAIRNISCTANASAASSTSTSYLNASPTYAAYNTINSYNNNPMINSFSVSSGPIGTSVTIYGTGFDSAYNNVYLDASPISGNIGSNGTTLTFNVPAMIAPGCGAYGCYTGSMIIGGGTYQVHVTNARGVSNSLPFTVTSAGNAGCTPYASYGSCGYGYGIYGNPTVSNVFPSGGAVGANVTIMGSGFSQRGNTVHFGTGIITNLMSSDGTSLSFTVPSQLTGYGSQSLSIGTYNISVSNEGGAASNTVPFSVTSFSWNATPAVLIFP